MKPKRLKKGDTIGVVATSEPITADCMEDIKRAVFRMNNLGINVKFGEFAFTNPTGYGEMAKNKAKDINLMFQDPMISGIFCAMGGFNVNSTFDYLDFEMIKNNPKIICGYSDPISILNIIYAKTGLVTFSGPNFKSLSDEKTDYGFNEMKKRFFDNDLRLGTKDDSYIVIKPGMAKGVLIGGNLSLVSSLITGKYMIDTKDKILFIEDLGFESPPGMISNYLYRCKQNGVFENIKGLWIGNYEHESGISLEKIVQDVLEDEYDFPIIKSDNFGHGLLKTVIPIGASAIIDTKADEKIRLLEEPLI